MAPRLIDFHEWLNQSCSDYISMIAVGSVVTGDDWIEGRSDHDVLLMFTADYKPQCPIIADYLSYHKFGDEYMFVPMLVDDYLRNNSHSHDFSAKFRSKTLYGKDVLIHKQLPTKEQTGVIISTGLRDVYKRLMRTVINGPHWSEEKIKNVLYQEFKHLFMYLAIKAYYDSGEYPVNRKSVAEFFRAPILVETFDTLVRIDSLNRDGLINGAARVLEYLEEIRETFQ